MAVLMAVAGCAESDRDPVAETSQESTVACAFLITGWNTQLQGTPGGPTDEAAYAAATDPDVCAIYHAGFTYGGRGGFGDAYVTRYSTTGSLVWTPAFGTRNASSPPALALRRARQGAIGAPGHARRSRRAPARCRRPRGRRADPPRQPHAAR